MATELSAEDLPRDLDPSALQGSADRLLQGLGLSSAELSVVLCDDAAIQELNAQWRGKDVPTDVLSFPQQRWSAPWPTSERDPAAPDPLDRALPEPMILGDIVISVQTAAAAAAERGHSLDIELAVLLVHGLLHLLGYDHEPPHDPARMAAEEVKLLGWLGVDGAAALVARAG